MRGSSHESEIHVSSSSMSCWLKGVALLPQSLPHLEIGLLPSLSLPVPPSRTCTGTSHSCSPPVQWHGQRMFSFLPLWSCPFGNGISASSDRRMSSPSVSLTSLQAEVQAQQALLKPDSRVHFFHLHIFLPQGAARDLYLLCPRLKTLWEVNFWASTNLCKEASSELQVPLQFVPSPPLGDRLCIYPSIFPCLSSNPATCSQVGFLGASLLGSGSARDCQILVSRTGFLLSHTV